MEDTAYLKADERGQSVAAGDGEIPGDGDRIADIAQISHTPYFSSDCETVLLSACASKFLIEVLAEQTMFTKLWE